MSCRLVFTKSHAAVSTSARYYVGQQVSGAELAHYT
jgi:hypothetical protein